MAITHLLFDQIEKFQLLELSTAHGLSCGVTTHNFGAQTGIKVRETEFCHEYRTRCGNTLQNIGL